MQNRSHRQTKQGTCIVLAAVHQCNGILVQFKGELEMYDVQFPKKAAGIFGIKSKNKQKNSIDFCKSVEVTSQKISNFNSSKVQNQNQVYAGSNHSRI